MLINLQFNYLQFLSDYNLTYTQLFSEGIFPLVFESFYQTYTYDPQDKETPLKKELGYVFFYNFIRSMYYINTKVSLVNSIQDNDYLFSSVTRDILSGITDWNTFSALNEALVDGIPIARINIWIDSQKEIIIRTYLKLQDVAAQITALLGMMGSVFSYFFRNYNIQIRTQLKRSLWSKLKR